MRMRIDYAGRTACLREIQTIDFVAGGIEQNVVVSTAGSKTTVFIHPVGKINLSISIKRRRKSQTYGENDSIRERIYDRNIS